MTLKTIQGFKDTQDAKHFAQAIEARTSGGQQFVLKAAAPAPAALSL